MEKDAVDFISTYGGQTVLDFEQCRKEEERVHAEKLFESIVDIRQDGVRLILEPIYDAMGFDAVGDDTLKFLSIAACQPQSKVATVEVDYTPVLVRYSGRWIRALVCAVPDNAIKYNRLIRIRPINRDNTS